MELLTDLVVGRTSRCDGSPQRVEDLGLCADTGDIRDCTARSLDRFKSGLLLVRSGQLDASEDMKSQLTAHAGRSAKLCAQTKGVATAITSAVG